MKMSELHIKTLKDSPFEGELYGQNFLFRAGMIKKIEVANYSFMPYGLSILKKMDDKITEFFRKDEFQQIALASHGGFLEFAKMLRSDIVSYKELPKKFFYNDICERDDYKVKLGLMKSKNFLEKKFTVIARDDEELLSEKKSMDEKLKSIFGSLNLDYEYTILQEKINSYPESSGFYIKNLYGDETYFNCKKCGYSAISHSAKCGYQNNSEEIELDREEIFTPEIKTILELESFLGIKADKLLKTLILNAKIDDEYKNVVVTLRGDRELNINKLSRILNIADGDIDFQENPRILEELGTFIGFAGPVGMKNAIIVSDEEVVNIKNMITGANKYNYHLRNVNYGRDYKADIIGDVKYNLKDDICPICGEKLNSDTGFTVSENLYYGKELGKSLDIKYRDENMKEKYASISFNSIDMYKLFGLYIEYNSDENGLCLSEECTEYDYQVIVVNPKKEEQIKLGEEICQKLLDMGFNVLIDDRNDRPGSKFKDSDLIGIPARIVAGKSSADRIVEFKERRAKDKIEIEVNELIEKVSFNRRY